MKIAIIRTTTPSSTGNQDYTVSGFGTPAAALVLINGATADDTTMDTNINGYGATDGTRQWSVGNKDLDNVGTTVARARSSTSHIITVTTKASGDTVGIQGAFSTWINDGIRINYATADYQAGITIILISCNNAYAGSKNVATAATHTVNEPGFRPNFLFGFMPIYLNQNSTAGINMSVGFAHEDGAGSVTQHSVVRFSQDNSATSNISATIYENRIGGDGNTDTVHYTAQNFGASGFDIVANSSRTSTHFWYLAIRDTEHNQGKVQCIRTPSSAGDAQFTGFGTKARYIFLTGNGRNTLNSVSYSSEASPFAIGVLGANIDCSQTTISRHNQGTSDTASRIGTGFKCYDRDSISSYAHAATLKSKDSDGFSLTFATCVRQAYYVALVIGPDTAQLAPAGIASGEAFGASKVNLAIIPSGIASEEAFGTAKINTQIVGIESIPSAEAFGTLNVNLNAVPAGIPSEEMVPAPEAVYFTLFVPSIGSGEVFGEPLIGRGVRAIGIQSEEAVPAPVLHHMYTIQPANIPSAEAFGVAFITTLVYPAGIDSEEAFGDVLVSTQLILLMSAIPSAEAFGAPYLFTLIIPSTITSSEAFGQPQLSSINPGGIDSREAFGIPGLIQKIAQVGNIFSLEALGRPKIGSAIQPFGIDSAEQFGMSQTILVLHPQGFSQGELGEPDIGFNIQPANIPSAEAFGVAFITTLVYPAGIDSEEAFGGPVLENSIQCAGIGSGEVFGVPSANLTLLPVAINSEERIGEPRVTHPVYAAGIPSEEMVPAPEAVYFTLFVPSIGSGEVFGTATLSAGLLLIPAGIASGEAVPAPRLHWAQQVVAAAIVSAESLGAPTVTRRVLNAFQHLLEDDFERAFFNTQEFAETAQYVPVHGAAFNLDGIFDNEYVAVQPDTGVAIQTSAPVFWTKTSKFTGRPVKGDRVKIRGSLYQVLSAEPDGTGVTVLTLHRHKVI